MSDQIEMLSKDTKILKKNINLINDSIIKLQSTQLTVSSNNKSYANAAAKSGNKNLPPTNVSENAPSTSDNSIVFFMDSNRKILNFNRLWDRSKTKLVSAATLYDIERSVNENITKDTECAVIACGTNDLDTKEPFQVSNEIDQVITKILNKNENIQIILSDLLPRGNPRMDDDVCVTNDYLYEWYRKERNVFLLSQDKFRKHDKFYLRDDKHLCEEAAPLYAAGFKFALRKCLDPPPTTSDHTGIRKSTPIKLQDNAWLSSGPVGVAPETPDLCLKIINAIKNCF